MSILDGATPAPAKTLEVKTAEKKKKMVANLEYEAWLTKDHQLLGYLFHSLSKDILVQVATLETSAKVWKELLRMFDLFPLQGAGY